jgi:hypothetical protein
MSRRLKTDLGEMRNRIVAALRHLFDLLENQVVVIAGERGTRCKSKDRKKNPSHAFFHREIRKRRKISWQRPVVIPSESRGIPRQNPTLIPRDPSTTLRFAQDDRCGGFSGERLRST